MIDINEEAFNKIAGPILESQLGDRSFMFGDDFTALDVIVGYTLATCSEKRDFLKNFPKLKMFVEMISKRQAFVQSTT